MPHLLNLQWYSQKAMYYSKGSWTLFIPDDGKYHNTDVYVIHKNGNIFPQWATFDFFAVWKCQMELQRL